MKYHWTTEGVEYASSPGAMTRPATDSGDVDAESTGQVLTWLLDYGPFWDVLDQREALHISITPQEEVSQ